MRILFFILFILAGSTCLPVAAQNVGRHSSEEKADTIITAYDDNTDSTVYTGMQRILNGVQPISYLTAIMKFSPQERIRPLRFGEGMKGYIIEAWIDQAFTFVQGRSQMDHFSQTSRISIRYAPALRMTKDNSSNLIPTNQKIGLQIDKVLWDDYTRFFFVADKGRRFDYVDSTSWFKDRRPFQMLHASFNAFHYSNGQGAGVYRSVQDSIIGRNDYIQGDFSTNVVRLELVYSYFKESLLSIALGYQRDSDWGGPFVFIDEQRGRYGMNRIVGFLQYRSKPLQNPIVRAIRVKDVYHDRSYRIKRLWEHRFRFDFEYILGNLDRFKRSKDYRFNSHFFYEISSLRTRTTGLVFHLYYGRDYMNIRYDDIIFAGSIGLSFSLTKYRQPRFNPKSYIIEEVNVSRYEEKQERNKSKLELP